LNKRRAITFIFFLIISLPILCKRPFDFIAIDSTNSLNIEQLESLRQFYYATPANVHVSDTGLTYWKKIRVGFKQSNTKILTENQAFKQMTIYKKTDKGYEYIAQKSLSRESNEHFTLDHLSFVISSERESEIYYIRIKIYQPCVLSAFTYNTPEFIKNESTTGFLHGLFTGIIIIIALYSISLYFVLREKLFLNYFAYLLSILLFAIVNWGLIKAILPVTLLSYYREFYTIPYMLMSLSLLGYLKNYLKYRTKAPFISKTINTLLLFRIFIFLSGLIFNIGFLYNQMVDTLIITAPLIILFRYFSVSMKSDRIFITAFIIVITGSSLHAINAFDIFASYAMPDAVYFSGILHTILFSVSLGIRINKLQEEKESAHQEIATISKQNKILSEGRIHQKIMSYEEFSAHFPDNESCYAYLEDMKWKDGFKCPVCDNTKFSKGNTPFSRRCSKCNHIETVTNNTIFYRIKFPIQKAFYLVYCVSTKKDYSISELAETLDLRRATCSKFIQKIKDRFQGIENQNQSQTTPYKSWVDLLMVG
jgi:chaperonin cofactor prefoldin